jgi:hypothetical protein
MPHAQLKARDMLLSAEEGAFLELLLATNSLDQNGYLRGLRYRPAAPIPRTEYLCWDLMRMTVASGYDAYDRDGWLAVLGMFCVFAGVDYDKVAYCAMNFVRLEDFLLPMEVA